MESEATVKKAGLGHNQPPSQAAFAHETALTIGDWLKSHPVIQTEEEAKEFKLLRDRGKCCVADMQQERSSRVRPLREQIRLIDEEYGEAKVLLDKVLMEGDSRVEVWIKQEEERRRKIKEEAWKRVQQAEEEARAASEREQIARGEAALGVETDIFSASCDAERALNVLGRVQREAARAERDEGVKVTGGHRRALGIRQQVTFIITDPILTVKDVGWSERLLSALEMDVRQYYQKFSTPPKGVQIKSERKVQ